MRARFNLAFVHIQEKDYPAALERIAEAFAHDKMGEYRDRLLQKLQEALALLTRRHQQEYLTLINLVSRYAKKEEGPGAKGQESAERTPTPPASNTASTEPGNTSVGFQSAL